MNANRPIFAGSPLNSPPTWMSRNRLSPMVPLAEWGSTPCTQSALSVTPNSFRHQRRPNDDLRLPHPLRHRRIHQHRRRRAAQADRRHATPVARRHLSPPRPIKAVRSLKAHKICQAVDEITSPSLASGQYFRIVQRCVTGQYHQCIGLLGSTAVGRRPFSSRTRVHHNHSRPRPSAA